MIRQRFADKKAVRITLLCSLLYFCSYITRKSFAACIVGISSAEGIADYMLSMSVTGLFITYGIGQLVSGYLGDRLPPKYVIAGGLFTSAVMNLFIPFCTSPWTMLIIWCVNGFAQSMIWPPLVKLLATELNAADYKRACFYVSCGCELGTIAVYVIPFLCIPVYGWRLVFYVCGGLAGIMVVLWLLLMKPENTSAKKVEKSGKSAVKFPKVMIFMLGAVMVAIAAQGAIKDGIITWMPSVMKEVFSLKNETAILSGVVLPIFAIISFRIAAALNKKLTNDVTCAAVLFGVGTVSLLCMFFFGMKNTWLGMVLLMLSTGSMHGVNLMLISMLPQKFGKYGRVSFATGLLNTCTYVGSAVSAYGIALFKTSFGWGNTFLLWSGIALLGLACCIAGKELVTLLGNREQRSGNWE